jgi:hypothetical protein
VHFSKGSDGALGHVGVYPTSIDVLLDAVETAASRTFGVSGCGGSAITPSGRRQRR